MPHKEWKLYEMRPENADIKYPWELGRCQHFLCLAQAYRLTGQERHARELIDQALDFAAANPIGRGIQWTCTMDVALRAANWCLALPLVADCETVAADDWETVYRHVFETGCFIAGNLENNYEVTSNHFLSNVIGLHLLAAEFADLPAGRDWDEFARSCLEREIVAQVLPDGADYESSVPYHRLVTELFLGSWLLAELQGRPLSEHYRSRLVDMVDFLQAVLRPDGRLPVIGDADDGRLMIATGYGTWRPSHGAHLLAPAGLALGHPAWSAWARALDAEAGLWEAFWWGLRWPAVLTSSPDPEQARLFPDAGLAVSRSLSSGAYLLVTNAIVGTSGFGNHKHNDLLSFEYCDRDVPLIVDPGSYVYTSDFPARNRFRGTAMHNTIMLDGVEQNEFNPEWLFRMFAKANPQHIRFESNSDGMVYEGCHDGYVQQLASPATHTRRFVHDRANGRLTLADTLSGSGTHEAVWHFHFDPNVAVRLDPVERAVNLSTRGMAWRLQWSTSNLEPHLIESSISPSYGVAIPSRALRLAGRTDLAAPYCVTFELAREGTAT